MFKRLIICFFACFLIFAIISTIDSLPLYAFDEITVSFDNEKTFRELDKEECRLFKDWLSYISSEADFPTDKDGNRYDELVKDEKLMTILYSNTFYPTQYIYLTEDEKGQQYIYVVRGSNKHFGWKYTDPTDTTEVFYLTLKS